jgi:recombination protein RecA
LIFINQIREKIGVMFGSPETTTGGRALKFYASVRLDVRKTQTIKDGDVAIGTETRVKVVKNKVSAPFKEAILRLYYGTGFSREADLLTVGTDKGIIEKSGAWYAYQGEKLGQGFEKTRLELVAHPELADKIETELREILFPAKKG